MPRVWYCPHCEKNVDEGQLEAHLLSNRHQRYVAWSQDRAVLEQRAANGELPRWMKLLADRTEWCTLCGCTATETHIASQKHKNQVAWSEMTLAQAPTAQASPAAQDQWALVPLWQPCGAPVFPHDWGDPSHFEWKPNEFQFWCKLCWKYATDNHVQSDRHKQRAANPEAYLYDVYPSTASAASGAQTGAPPLPPERPPLGARGPPPVPPQTDAPPPPPGAPPQGQRVPPPPPAVAQPTLQPMQSPSLTAMRPKATGYPQPPTHGAPMPPEPQDPWMDDDPWGGSQQMRQKHTQSVAANPAEKATPQTTAANPQIFDMAAEDTPRTEATEDEDVPLTMPTNVQWERQWDDTYKHAYFWNPVTEDSRWKMPPEQVWREDV